MNDQNLISKVVQIAGLKPCANACGVSYQAVRKWEKQGHLPRTDFSGETTYAKKLAQLVNDKIEAGLLSMKPESTSSYID